MRRLAYIMLSVAFYSHPSLFFQYTSTHPDQPTTLNIKKRTHRSASLYASLLPLGSIFLGPYFGHRVDVELGKPDRGWHGWWRRGRTDTGGGSNAQQVAAVAATAESGGRRGWQALPGLVQLYAMLVTVFGLALTSVRPHAWVVGFVAMGLGFAMASAALWPMIPVFVSGHSLGLGFGIVHAIMDLVLLLINILVGRLLDAGKSYPGTVLPLLLGIALVGLVASVLQIRLLLARRQEEGEKDAEALVREGPSAQYPALLPAQRTSGDVESG